MYLNSDGHTRHVRYFKLIRINIIETCDERDEYSVGLEA